MNALVLIAEFRDFLADSGWIFLAAAAVGSFVLALIEQREFFEKKAILKGEKKVWAIIKITFFWIVTSVTIMGAISSQFGSDRADKKIQGFEARHLNESQKLKLREMFSKTSSQTYRDEAVEVEQINKDFEALAFANEISSNLEALNCFAVAWARQSNEDGADSNGIPARGIIIFVHDFKNPPKLLAPIRKAFFEIGLNPTLRERPQQNEKCVDVFIGPKP